DLTSAGTLTVNQPLSLCGSLTNTGTVAANKDLIVSSGSASANQGTLTIADTVVANIAGPFTNAAGGSIFETGSGKLIVSGGAFNHGGTIPGPGTFQVELLSADL